MATIDLYVMNADGTGTSMQVTNIGWAAT